MFREKKGTTIVEAAVVFPLVILTVITCVLVCMFFYSQTISQSALHIEMRDYAGQISGHTVYLGSGAGSHLSGSGSYGSGSSGSGSFVSGSTGGNRASITKEKRSLFYIVRGKENVSMKNKGILSGRTDQTIESIWTASDGVGYVRYCTLGNYVAEDILNYK